MTAGLRAVLDVGSNTIRLLVAQVEGDGLTQILDQSEFVRLGKDVDATHELQADRMDAAVVAIRTLSATARREGAEKIVAVATSAVRDARNGAAFARRVHEETEIDLDIISGDREAALTFRGATLGIPIEGPIVVCDLGGGSAEVILAGKDGMQWGRALPLGSGRLTERFIKHDPPEPGDLDALRAGVEEVLQTLPPAQAGCAIFTGGTATQLLRLAGAAAENGEMDMATVENVLQLVITHSSSELVERFDVPPGRAQVVAAGIAAIHTIARFYGVSHVRVSFHGIREGAILEMGA